MKTIGTVSDWMSDWMDRHPLLFLATYVLSCVLVALTFRRPDR